MQRDRRGQVYDNDVKGNKRRYLRKEREVSYTNVDHGSSKVRTESFWIWQSGQTLDSNPWYQKKTGDKSVATVLYLPGLSDCTRNSQMTQARRMRDLLQHFAYHYEEIDLRSFLFPWNQ